MIKSNTKQFRDKVKKYVIEHISAEASTPEEALRNTLEDFRAFYCPYEKKLNPSITNALIHFFNTGVMDLSIWYDEQRALLKEWFDQTEAEAKKYDNIQVSNKFYYQVAKAYISLINRRRIKKWIKNMNYIMLIMRQKTEHKKSLKK